jgi:hypothetical protein
VRVAVRASNGCNPFHHHTSTTLGVSTEQLVNTNSRHGATGAPTQPTVSNAGAVDRRESTERLTGNVHSGFGHV